MTTGHGQHGHETPDSYGAAFWDERYSASSALWSGDPNPHLVTEAGDLGPGSALDVGCGEGADAIWLAERGWRVTAVDISSVALQRGAAHAKQVDDDVARRITWLQADLIDWVPPGGSFDLVSAQFMHLPKDQREALFGRLAASVTPGGSLLVVGHHPLDLQTTARRPPRPEMFFTAADVAASLDPMAWDTAVSAVRARPSIDPDGNTITIHDAVLRAVRKR